NASSNPKIYDANGNTFRPRGVNRLHWGDNGDAGIAASGANCERYVFGWVAALFNTYLPLIISDGIVPIAVDFLSSTGTVTSGDTNPATITQVVSDWINGVGGVGGAAAWKPFEKYLIL